jgi:lipase maturation factor 1
MARCMSSAVGGVVLSILLILGIAPIPVLALLWACYLSLAVAGQAFLGFQWDVLLIEAAFAAMFFAPWSLIPRRSRETPVPFIGLWLLRWLLFRVMFLSGVLKLTSGDMHWHDLTAMQYHYFTQPIPTWTSWYFHNMPAWFQTMGALYMFYAELAAPLMIFGPRRVRLLAFWSILLLQLLIAATGNFGFFNVLTIVLCIPLLDDNCFPRRLRCTVRLLPLRHLWRWQWIATVPVALVVLVISSIPLVNSFNWYPRWPTPIATVESAIAPFRTINGYGLFRVMTTERNEIQIEGSDDQQTWLAYSFKWKPCDTKCAPAFCAPHMPRLDWQMWFAALGGIDDNQWLVNLGGRLLEGSKPVLALLDQSKNPFPNHPPKYIRFQFYKYTFTDPATRKATGAWWNREPLGPYWSGILSKRTAENANP